MPILIAFLSLLYYKILSSFLFSDSVTIIAAVIMAICTAILATGLTLSFGYAMASFPQGSGRILGIVAFVVAAAGLNAGLGWLIVHGFSEDFSDQLSGYYGRRELPWFAVMMAGPILIHAATMWIALKPNRSL